MKALKGPPKILSHGGVSWLSNDTEIIPLTLHFADIISKFNDISQVYGPHVKLFAGNEAILLLSDPSDIKTFFNHHESLYKPELIYQDFTNILGNGLATANGDKVKQQYV